MAKALERMNMKHEGWIDRQTIAGECRAVIAEYCCCDIGVRAVISMKTARA